MAHDGEAGDARYHEARRNEPVAAIGPREMAVLSRIARLLFANGQTTERMAGTLERVANRFGTSLSVFADWGEITLRLSDRRTVRSEFVAATPSGVDMRKVAATMALAEGLCDRNLSDWTMHDRIGDLASTEAALDAVAALGPLSLVRFALLAAAGAAALAVVFGAIGGWELATIAAVAGFGAVLRRWLAGLTGNLFVQPLSAALLAGIVGAVALRYGAGRFSGLVVLCPCMVLVPGPHLLNGALDLVRGRMTLGVARVVYAGMTILMIAAGLLLGLAVGGMSLPAGAPATPVPLALDVIPAGIAVLAYGTFFSMPWRMLPIPVVIGMSAHALRWVLIYRLQASPSLGAFGACLLVGTAMTPIADRLHLPFAGCAFASVVSLIPGVYLFRMAGTLVDLVSGGGTASADLLAAAAADGVTAITIMIAIAAGLILPKFLMEGWMERD